MTEDHRHRDDDKRWKDWTHLMLNVPTQLNLFFIFDKMRRLFILPVTDSYLDQTQLIITRNKQSNMEKYDGY